MSLFYRCICGIETVGAAERLYGEGNVGTGTGVRLAGRGEGGGGTGREGLKSV